MDGVTVVLGLMAVSVLAVIVLWSTRNKGVVGKRVVVGESTPQITVTLQDGMGETDPADDWEIVPVTRIRRPRGHKHVNDERVPQPLLDPLSASLAAHQDAVTQADVGKMPGAPRELIVVLNIIASQQQWLEGSRVINAVRNTGMQYSEPGIFHYVAPESPQGEPLFSLANMLNPGIFKMDELEQLTTPGVTLFMRLPGATAGPINGLDAFARMHDTARELAQMLNAEVCDERRLILTEVAASRLRDRITQHQGVH